jgi:mono/diheme cytochrome c family protein
MMSVRKLANALPILPLVMTVSCTQPEPPAPPVAQAQQATPKQAQPELPPSIQYEAHISAGGAAPAGGNLANPHKGNKAIAESGATLFSTMNCDGCHGGGATGWAAPSLADGRWRYGGADNEIFQSIYYGRPKGMPAFGGVLGPDGIWILVTYLQSLPVPDNVPTQSWDKP